MEKGQTDSDFITGLVGISGPLSGKRIEITGTLTTIGGEFADIDLSQDKSVSPQHCYITIEDGEYWLYNAEGSSGTLFSGNRVKRAKLRDGDKITIGKTSFIWNDKSESARPKRNNKDIEFESVEPIKQPVVTHTRVDTKYIQKSSDLPKTGVNSGIKAVSLIIVAIIILYCAYAYFMLPAIETKKIDRHIDQYWNDYTLLMNTDAASLHLAAIRGEAEDFDCSSLDSIELSTTFFSNIGRPQAARRTNLNRIRVIQISTEIMNAIRHEDLPIEQYKAIFKLVNDLKTIDLSTDKDWTEKRDWLLGKFRAIQDQLKVNAASDPYKFLPAEPTPYLTEARDDFRSAYYIYNKENGMMSSELGDKAFKYFDSARAKYNAILRSNRDDKEATTVIILCDYLMVDLRMKMNIEWEQRHIASSINFLKEGFDMLENISSDDFRKNVPPEVKDYDLRQASTLRAKYSILVDQFERKTKSDTGLN